MKHIFLEDVTPVPTSHNEAILKKVIAANGQIPHIVQIAQAILKPGDQVESHSHDDLYEIFYIEKGSVEVVVNGTPSIVNENETIIIEPHDTHEFLNRSNQDTKMFYFGVTLG